MFYIRAVTMASTKTNPARPGKLNLDITGRSFYHVTNFSCRWFIGRNRVRFADGIGFELTAPDFRTTLKRLRLFRH